MGRRLLTIAGPVLLLVLLVGVPGPRAVAARVRRSATSHALTRPVSTSPVVGMATDPATGGYWMATADGAVFAFGAPFHGSMGGTPLNQPIVGIAATPDGGGYWLVGADGGLFAFGDAPFRGSMGGAPLTRPIVGIAADPASGGYWEVAADGGLFAFGAPFLGSMGGEPLNQPVVGMAASSDGGGYREVAADGGLFAFGDAPFRGSMGGAPLTRPVVGIDDEPGSTGYREVAADGGLFSFGAPYRGSMGGTPLNRAVVGMSSTPDGGGYRLVGADGGLFAFGDAPYLGSVDVLPLAGLTVAIDPGHDGGNGGDPAFIDQPIDGGGFIEPCDTAGTVTPGGYPEHAFNFDVAVRAEERLRAEGATVVLTRPDDTGVGPCVDTRAAIGNDAHAAAAVSIHADGGPPGGRGYTVIEPAPVVSPTSDNTAIVGPSARLGALMDAAFGADTGEMPSTYDGTGGTDVRDNLGGLNLSTVPKVLIECADMQNAADAALTESPAWRQLAAQGITDGITQFLMAGLRT